MLLASCGGHQVKKARPAAPKPPNKTSVVQVLNQAQRSALDGHLDAARAGLRALKGRQLNASAKRQVQFIRAVLVAEKDASAGVTALLRLLRTEPEPPLLDTARHTAIRYAVRGKRCMTAQSLFGKIKTPSLALKVMFSKCQTSAQAIMTLIQAVRSHPQDRKWADELRSRIRTAQTTTLAKSFEHLTDAKIKRLFARELVRRNDRPTEPLVLRSIYDALAEDDPGRQTLLPLLSRPRVRVILPLSGENRPTGQRLKDVLEALSSDETHTLPLLEYFDGSDADKALTALSKTPAEGTFFATIALLDIATAERVIKQEGDRTEPLITVTRSSSPTKARGAVWRALDSPLLSARTIAKAALDRDVKRILTIRRGVRDSSAVYAYWLKRVCGAVTGLEYKEIVVDSATIDFQKLVREINQITFDGLFLPLDAPTSLTILQHLAGANIWAGDRIVARAEDGRRQAFVFGVPDWSNTQAMTGARRYGQHAIYPAFFSRHTGPGKIFSDEIEKATGSQATAVTAIVFDLLIALQNAFKTSIEKRLSAAAAVATIRFDSGVTAGFDFTKRDAASQLFLMRLTTKGPVQVKSESQDVR